MRERTLCLIKPDAVERNHIGGIVGMIEKSDLCVVAMKMLWFGKREAEGFYAVHKERPFFASLVDSMCAGPLVACVLEGKNAITVYRALMGATNPAEAKEGTIRKTFALDLERNSVHGSDSAASAATEIPFLFSACELVGQGK